MRPCWPRSFAPCTPSREPRDFWASSAWRNWLTPARTCSACCATRKLTADAAVITALLQLLDGLRAILKIIETEGGEGAGDDAALIERLEELQAPVRTAAKPVHAEAGATPARECRAASSSGQRSPSPAHGCACCRPQPRSAPRCALPSRRRRSRCPRQAPPPTPPKDAPRRLEPPRKAPCASTSPCSTA